MKMHELVKVGKTYGKIIKKKTEMINGRKRIQYLVITKKGNKRWCFKSEMTLIW